MGLLRKGQIGNICRSVIAITSRIDTTAVLQLYDRTNKFYCCYSDGQTTTRSTTTTTTTTTTTQPPPPPPSKKCFPSTARVNLETGKSVSMSELQIGDKIQIGRVEFHYWNNSLS